MKHSQLHITLYWEVILFIFCGKILREVESLVMILFSASLASLIPPSSGIITMLLYLPPDWVGKYWVTYHNNVTRISSAVFYDVYRYMDTLFPWPCLQHYCKNDNHEVVLNSYRLQKYNWVFLQTFCSVHFDFCL